MSEKNLQALCGKTGFKTVQALRGHERMCKSCQSIARGAGPGREQQVCVHSYRPLTFQERQKKNGEGVTIEALGFDVVCVKCGEMK